MVENMTFPPTRLLTVKEAAARIGRSEAALRWLIHSGKGPKSAIVGGRRVFRESDLETWIAQAFAENTDIVA